MISRIALLLVTSFWLVMNFLLWRAEFGGRDDLGNQVPVAVVWRKILTAPDNSSLDILHHGKKVGYCHWSTGLGRAAAQAGGAVEAGSADSPAKADDYWLELEGAATLAESLPKMGFGLSLKLAANRDWRELNARFSFHRTTVVIHSAAAGQKIHLRVDDEGQKTERTISLAGLGNPLTLARELKLPLPAELVTAAESLPDQQKSASLPALNWEARNAWVNVGHTTVRVYHLRARLFDRRQVTIMVSPVGEILRVELPDEWVLVNDGLGVL